MIQAKLRPLLLRQCPAKLIVLTFIHRRKAYGLGPLSGCGRVWKKHERARSSFTTDEQGVIKLLADRKTGRPGEIVIQDEKEMKIRLEAW